MSVSLIINADDLGLSEEINNGILLGLEQGFLSDASLLAKARFAGQAAKGLKDRGILHAGIHINLDELFGWKPGGIELIPRPVLIESLKDRSLLLGCSREAREQILVFLSFGLTPSHLDTHHHVHGFTPIFEILVDLMEEFRITALRFSRHGYRLPTRENIPFDNSTYAYMESMLRHKGIFHCPQYLEGAERINDDLVGLTELVVHPSLGGDSWRSNELEVLQREVRPGRLSSRDMELVSYKAAQERGLKTL